jgi:hypothetical protein
MKTTTTLACLLAAVAASPAASGFQAAEREHRSTLTRVREGGTPYDPNQPLVPYPVRIGGPEGTAASSTRPHAACSSSTATAGTRW